MADILIGEFQFRILKSSWGIWINVAGTITDREKWTRTDGYDPVSECIVLRVASSSHAVKEYAFRGIQRVRNLIKSRYPGGAAIDISELGIANSDFQIEAIEFAVIEWISKLLGIPCPSWTATFVKDKNCYHFEYDKLEQE